MDPYHSQGSSSNPLTLVREAVASGRNLLGQCTAPLWQKAIWFSVAYFLCAEASNYLSPRGFPVRIFWLPAGLYVAVLLLNETRAWPWLVLAALPANLVFDRLQGTPLPVFFSFFGANTVQAVTGAWLMRRFVAERPSLRTEKEFYGLTVFLAMGSPVLGALIGATTLVASGLRHSFGQSWLTWWLLDMSAIMVVTPFILAWFSAPDDYHQRFFNGRKKVLEAVLLVAAALAVCAFFLFYSNGIMSPNKSPVLMVLMWAGIRFGTRGATAIGLLMAVMFLFFTTQYFSGLTRDQISSGSYIISLQIAWVMTSLVGLLPAMVLRQRDDKLEELRVSETKFRTLVEHIPQKIFLKDRDLRYLSANDNYTRDLGIRPPAISGRDDFDFFPRELAQKYRADDRRILETGKTEDFEEKYLHQGRACWVHTVKTPVRNLKGEITGVFGIFWDITERKRAVEQIEMLKVSIDQHFDAAFWMDTSNQFVFVNDTACKVLGYAREELLGKPVTLIAPQATPPILEEVWQRLRATGFFSRESVHRRKDGSEFPVEVVATYVRFEGTEFNCGFAREITGRKRIEQELERHRSNLEDLVVERTAELQLSRDKTEAAYQKLRELEKLRDDLVHMVVHDMRSPLASLGMYLDMLSPEELKAPDFKKNLALIRETSRALSGMVTSLLDVSRMEAGQMPLHCAVSDLGQLTSAALKQLSGLVQDRHISVHGSDAPVLAWCDPVITGRIFENLLGNALKFTPAAGSVRIELAGAGSWAQFSITDTGPGISAIYHGKIFEKFGQVEMRKDRKMPSSGLGLTFCKLAVEAQGGKILLESEPGCGATFHVRLPARYAQASPGKCGLKAPFKFRWWLPRSAGL